MKKIRRLTLLLLLVVGFTGCSNDDAEESPMYEFGDVVLDLFACGETYTLIAEKANGDVYDALVDCGFYLAYKERVGEAIRSVIVIPNCQ
ncbi:MAG: hypothetical protein HEP71_34250 [Roseivirga sp.]|nr:hypothetical protein [Roseivirga sp.]